jgi:hypothetical protein
MLNSRRGSPLIVTDRAGDPPARTLGKRGERAEMTGYPLLDIFLSTMYFFFWILWIMLVFWIVWDIFRSPDLSGWGKAGWLILVLVLPVIGILAYLIARGSDMQERRMGMGAGPRYTPGTAHSDYGAQATEGDGHSQSEELAKLAGLHQRGIINDQEFQRAKERILV